MRRPRLRIPPGAAAFCLGFGAVAALAAIPWDTQPGPGSSGVRPALASAPLPVAAEPLPEPPPDLRARPAIVEVPRLADGLFKELALQQPWLLGSVSIGRPNRGFLYNGVHLGEGDGWELVDPDRGWGTQETISALVSAIQEVRRVYPETPKLQVGHISRRGGGWLRPHRSHQSGRDVDLGYYYVGEQQWYRVATPENLDVPRTWALLSALARSGQLEYAFADGSLHGVLRAHAESLAEAPAFLAAFFDGGVEKGPILRHARGHATHLHVRFLSSVAVENAWRAVRVLGPRTRAPARLFSALHQQQKVQRMRLARR